MNFMDNIGIIGVFISIQNQIIPYSKCSSNTLNLAGSSHAFYKGYQFVHFAAVCNKSVFVFGTEISMISSFLIFDCAIGNFSEPTVLHQYIQ